METPSSGVLKHYVLTSQLTLLLQSIIQKYRAQFEDEIIMDGVSVLDAVVNDE